MKFVAHMLIAIMIAGILLIPTVQIKAQSEHQNQIEKAMISTTSSYPNSDIATLWVRPDGSELPTFPYVPPYQYNVSPLVGMSYFGTNILQVTWDYALSWINQTYTFFPADSKIIIQAQYDP